jgi:hypothetical protein
MCQERFVGRVDVLIRELNAEESLPRFAYRRNAPIYPLVCTVNGIIGCYLSNNKDVISVLVERARLFMADNPANDDNLRYYELVHEIVYYFST